MSAIPARCSSSRGAGLPGTLHHEVVELRQLEQQLAARLRATPGERLPGNAAFLADGRVLCRERARGDSRYPYGRDGFNFWVYASGYMHGNDGLYFAFLPFQEGQEPPVAFFLGQRLPDGTYRPIPILPVPYIAASDGHVTNRYTVFGPDAAYFAVETPELAAVLRVFVDQGHAEHADVAFSLHIENRSKGDLELFVSAYMNPFCRHQFAETCEDRWFKKIWVDQPRFVAAEGRHGAELPPFHVAVNEDVSRFQSVTNRALVRRATTCTELETEVCTSRRGYMGHHRIGLAQANALFAGRFGEQVPLTVFNDNAVVGDLNRFRLAGCDITRFDYVLSLLKSDASYHEELRTAITAQTVDRACACHRSELAATAPQLGLTMRGSRLTGIPDETFNRFFPYLLTQVRVCAQVRGYMQPSPNSLIGIRDVFQAIEGHLYDEPQRAREKICEALGFVLTDGRCPRQYSLPVNGVPGRADLREFIDQGVWVVSTVYTYLGVTGDAGLLNETLGYHKLSDSPIVIVPAEEERGTVLDHLIRIMGFLAKQRDPETHLVLALYGDWNDAVDGLGTTREPGRKFGTGVSVMASLQFYQNCREMAEILQRYFPGQYLDQVRQYQQLQAELEAALREHAVVRQGDAARVVHGWGDRQSYYVGSFMDSDSQPRDSLTSNAFWVLAGLLAREPSLKPQILQAFERLDSPYGLRTFAPGFAPDAPGVGRVRKLPLGTAENGATYIHATAFGIMALFQMGAARAAWQQIEKILPFAPHQQGLSHSPFVLPNSYVHNPELNLTGQNMNDWQTGSSNVLLKLLIRHVCGFQPGLDALRVAPAAWFPCDGFEFRGVAHGRRVVIERTTDAVERRRCRLNGAELATHVDPQTGTVGVMIPYDRLSAERENRIEVIDPREDR
jgi:cellobiose phosphorylase